MNLVANERTQALVYRLVARDRSHALKLIGNYERLKVRIVLGEHPHRGITETRFDQPRYFQWIHHASLCKGPIVYDIWPGRARLKNK